MSGATGEPELLVRIEGGLGRLTLNRPGAINALSAAMVRTLAQTLAAWETDQRVRMVLINGAGERGLCAGGDIRALHRAICGGTMAAAIDFMADEYRLNARIAAFPKPYVAFMDGVVMGGGVGVSAHGSARLVTGRTSLAMPETSIGLFPDVGGTFLLGRAPGELGTHLALTGGRVGAGDALLLGLADRHIPTDSLDALAIRLAACNNAAAAWAAIDAIATPPPAGLLAGQRGWIDRCYAHNSVEAILAALDEAPEADAHAAAAAIRRNAPTSLKVTLRALRLARASPELFGCLEREFRMVNQALAAPDFSEGVRASLIDKDRAPRWLPATLDAVDEALVELYFAPKPRSLGLDGAAWARQHAHLGQAIAPPV